MFEDLRKAWNYYLMAKAKKIPNDYINIGFICDLHIGHNPFESHGVSLDEFLALQYDSLVYQLDTLRHECDHIIFAGDTFDTAYPSQDMLALLLRALAKYPDLQYYFILGNHEIDTTDKTKNAIKHALVSLKEAAQLVDNIHVYVEYTETEIEGFPVTFMSWPQTKCDRKGLVVLHNEFRGTQRDNGTVHEDGEAFAKNNAKLNNQFFVSGHLHTTQSHHCDANVEYKNTSGLYYPGRFGASRHDRGDFNSYCYVMISQVDDDTFDYCVKPYVSDPFWILQRMDFDSAEDLDYKIDDIPSSIEDKHISIVVSSQTSKYVPDAEVLAKYPFVRVLDKKRTALLVAQEITGDTKSVNFMQEYTDNWITRVKKKALSPFMQKRFDRLHNDVK